MTSGKISFWFVAIGVAVLACGVALGMFTGRPGDANIGAGLLVLAGVVAAASGLLMRWLDRSSTSGSRTQPQGGGDRTP